MDFMAICKLQEEHVEGLLKEVIDALKSNAHMSTFSKLPTLMLFKPQENLDSSFHYMLFPEGEKQIFHYHPSARYLLILGDVDMHVHYNECSLEKNPYDNHETLILPAYTLGIVRYEANIWHYFESMKGDNNLGVIAFSFHDKDVVDDIHDNLMEELTYFYNA